MDGGGRNCTAGVFDKSIAAGYWQKIKSTCNLRLNYKLVRNRYRVFIVTEITKINIADIETWCLGHVSTLEVQTVKASFVNFVLSGILIFADSYRWFSARLQYLQCVSSWATAVLHWTIYIMYFFKSRSYLEGTHYDVVVMTHAYS